MDDREKSDGRVLPEKLPNNAQGGAAEAVEGRRPAKGNTTGETRPGLSAGQGALSELGRVRRVAATDKEARFTALLHQRDTLAGSRLFTISSESRLGMRLGT